MLTLLQPTNNPAVEGYALFQSDFVKENQAQLILDAYDAHKRFDAAVSFNNVDSTRGYKYYNLFALTAGSTLFYKLHQQLTSAIKLIIPDGRELWFQCWLNYHMPNEVLKRHCHIECVVHGYLSLDPKNTSTVFDSFAIKNEVGKIYIGPGLNFHEVVVHEPYDTPRLTIAFDVVDAGVMANLVKTHGFDVNLSYIPV